MRERPGVEIAIQYERDGRLFDGFLTPARKVSDSGEAYGQVGVSVSLPEWPPEMVR